jgi:hypothetical protein
MARLDCVQKYWLSAMHYVAHLPGPLPDYCPAFKHNWVRVLARAAGVPDGQLVPVQLPLAGENVGRLARAGQ